MPLSEEIHIAFSNWWLLGESNFGVIEVDPLAILLDIANIMTARDTSSQVSDKTVEVIETWFLVLIG